MIIDKYPHIKELFRLGGPESEEGRAYIEKNHDILDYEYSASVDVMRYRDMIGKNKEIHKINDFKYIK